MPVDDGLIDCFLDGDVTDDETADIMQWLEVPANLERFARRAELHAALPSSLRRRTIQSRAVIRNSDGELQSAVGDTLLPLKTWLHVVMTVDDEELRIYESGQLAAPTTGSLIATSDSEAVWFGTGADGFGVWNGRIDELALFDKALSEKDIAELYQAALEEMARSQ